MAGEMATSLRILLIAPTKSGVAGGGQARFGSLLSAQLQRRHDVTVLRVPYSGELSAFRRLVVSATVAVRAVRTIRRRRIDVVHIFSPCHRAGFYEKLLLACFCRAAGGQTIFNFRNAFDHWFEQWTPLERWLTSRLLRLNSVLLCQYEALRQYLVHSRVVINEDQVRVLPNGVDLEEAPQMRLSPPRRSGEPVKIVFVGDVGARKGVDVLIHALRLLKERLDTPQFIVSAYGCMTTAAHIVNACQSAELDGLIDFRGPVDHHVKWTALADADVFVLPSRVEGFPNAALEAMAAGLPLIVSNVGALGEIVTENKCGLLIPANDSSALAQGLQVLIEDSTLRRNLGSAARHAVETRYDMRIVADQFARLYEEIAGSNMARSTHDSTGLSAASAAQQST